jgi:hypothetical protein
MNYNFPVIIDNFLDESVFTNLKSELLSNTFDWYYNNCIVGSNETLKKDAENYQFIHNFYKENHGITGQSFFILKPLLLKINPKLLIRIKANLNPKTNTKKIIGSYHIDCNMNCKTAIFYINTNNGYTKFKNNNNVVNCISNRLIVFDSNLEHVGFSCTDEDVRVVVNINYFPN